MIVLKLLDLYALILLARVILSWVNPDPYNPIVRFLRSATDPVLVPLQRIIPPIGGIIDITPLIALLLIQLIKRLIIQSLYF